MKKTVGLVLIGLLGFSFLLPSPIWARVVSSDRPVAVSADEVIEDDLYIAGPQVTVAGTVEGDLYAAGGAVDISGTVDGDVLVAGGNVKVTGDVGNALRIAGGMVEITGVEVGDSLTVLGGSVQIDEETVIGGGFNFLAGNLRIDGDIGRGLTGGAGSLTLSGDVGKGVDVAAGTFSLSGEARVAEDIQYQADGEIRIDPEATVSGDIRRIVTEDPKIAPGSFERARSMFRAGLRALRFISFLSALLVGSLFIYLFQNAAIAVSKNIVERPWRSLLWGFLALVFFPFAFFLLLITVLGLPLAFMLIAFVLLSTYLAQIFVGLVLGQAILELFEGLNYNVYLSLALGLAAYFILGVIPVLGFFVTLFTTFFGLGAFLIYLRNRIFVNQ